MELVQTCLLNWLKLDGGALNVGVGLSWLEKKDWFELAGGTGFIWLIGLV